MEKRHPGASRIALIALLILPFLLLSTTVLPAAPDDGSAKDSFKKMGRAIGKAGKEVGKSAAQAGKVVGKESRKILVSGRQGEQAGPGEGEGRGAPGHPEDAGGHGPEHRVAQAGAGPPGRAGGGEEPGRLRR